MPSDSNGVYSLPAGYLAETGETILASQHNPPLEDIASSMTLRLMRSGVTPMTGSLKGYGGTVSAPDYSFSGATTTGIYKTTDGIGFAVGGAQVGEFTAAGGTFTGSLTFSGTVSFTATTAVGVPVGTTAQEPAVGNGKVRYDTTLSRLRVSGASAFSSVVTQDDIATQAEMETPVSATKLVPASRVNNHPGVAKVLALLTVSGTSNPFGHNVASISKNGTGDYVVNYTVPFSSVNYCVFVTPEETSTTMYWRVISRTVSSVRIAITGVATGLPVDPSAVSVSCFGDQ